MTTDTTIYLAVIVVYIVAIFFISWWRSRGVKSQEEFMVAGRSSPAWLLVGSLICTWIGAGSLIGGGGRAYREGFSQLWLSGGAWLGIIIIFFLADRVRKISQFTVQDILEKRYHPAARILGSIAVILGSVIIFAYQLRGMAFVTEYLFGLPQYWGIIACGCLILGFTVFAGLKSILAMDVLNGTLIILGILIGLPTMLVMVGNGDIGAGAAHVVQTLPEKNFSLFGSHDFIWAMGVFFPTLFLLLGESSIYMKFYSAKDGKTARKAVIGFLVGVVIVEIALAGFAVTSSSHPNMHIWRTSHDAFVAAVEGGADAATLDARWNEFQESTVAAEAARTVRPENSQEALALADSIYNRRSDSINLRSAFELPIWAGALFLAGGMAIIFSTGNSFLMAASSSFSRDIWQRFIRPQTSEKQLIAIQRIAMICMVVFGISILTVFTTVWQMALAAYTIIGASLTPVILAAFLWKRATPAGGVASIGLGLVVWTVTVTLKITNILPESFDYDFIIYPAGGASILGLIIVSLLTKPAAPEVLKEFSSSK